MQRVLVVLVECGYGDEEGKGIVSDDFKVVSAPFMTAQKRADPSYLKPSNKKGKAVICRDLALLLLS
jgi:hypothetical protein